MSIIYRGNPLLSPSFAQVTKAEEVSNTTQNLARHSLVLFENFKNSKFHLQSNEEKVRGDPQPSYGGTDRGGWTEGSGDGSM